MTKAGVIMRHLSFAINWDWEGKCLYINRAIKLIYHYDIIYVGYVRLEAPL